VSSQIDLGRIDPDAQRGRRLAPVRMLLPLGWVLACVGFFGPWVAHTTAGLTITGVDMAEFVKFLPGVLDGSLPVARQLFYLPPLVVVVSVALLIGSRELRYPGPMQALFLALAVLVSLQLLPPAWSPASLRTSEFRLQAIALGGCWLLLAGFWLLARLPTWLTGSLTALVALVALILSGWQFLIAKPGIDGVYGIPPSTGWGLYLCLTGLALLAAAGALLAWLTRLQARRAEL